MQKENKLSQSIRNALSLTIAMTFSTFAMSQLAHAQSTATPSADETERLVVTGSRGSPRTVSDSPVPVDVLTADDITAVSFSETNDIVRTLVPSFSVPRLGGDGAAFTRQASMRGMSSDKILVLVNGKRRHRSAMVLLSGSGSQGPDLATIPASALKTVEVLRDGAAAQYGSDAIAGVLNFHLKDNSEGGEFTVDYGEYKAGDGENVVVAGNLGFALGDKGFLSISAEISEQNSVDRHTTQYCASVFCLDPNDPRYNENAAYNEYLQDPVFMAAVTEMGHSVQPSGGQPELNAKRMFFNAGYDLTDTTELYAYGNYSKSDSTSIFVYRHPYQPFMQPVRLEDGSLWSALDRYPGGYTPRFHSIIYDYSLALGIKGEFSNGIGYDFSGRFGHNEINYGLTNTLNLSMGPTSPTSFLPGSLTNEELQLQADFVQDIEVSFFDSPLVLAYGLSYMEETYELGLGDELSYQAGTYSVQDPYGFCNGGVATAAGSALDPALGLDCANPSDPVYRVLPHGSNGFPGYGPVEAQKNTRDSYHLYVDLSANVTENLFVQTAFRYEDYSDFGSELVGKIAGKLDITDTFGIRASYGTGFRAPTMGQQNTINASTSFVNNQPLALYTFPATHVVGQALGAEALKPELSTNYTLGLVADFGRLTVTLDWYRIDLEDAFYFMSTKLISEDGIVAGYSLEESQALYPDALSDFWAVESVVGIDQARLINGVKLAQNAFDTRSEGVDLVANYSFTSDYGLTTLTAAVNYNEKSFRSDASPYMNAESRFDFEKNSPKIRGVFTAKQSFGDLTVLARANYYGSYENAGSNNIIPANIQKFDPSVLVDLEASYQLTDNVRLSAGGRNVFDKYPPIATQNVNASRVYFDAAGTPDWQGAYYYTKVNVTF